MPSTPTEPIQDPTRRYRCRHIFTDGHRCGSPSLRGEDLCYYHHQTRHDAQLAGRNGQFLMPRIDDRPAIQLAIYDILSRLAQYDIDPKRAGMLLYGLQIASTNLAKHEKSAINTEPVVEELAFSPLYGDIAPITEIPAETAAISIDPPTPVISTEALLAPPPTPVISTGGDAPVAAVERPPHSVPAQLLPKPRRPATHNLQPATKNRLPRCERNRRAALSVAD